MMQYGFQRLVLLGSAGYSRAELPLDGAVSLVAPNNTGKTSLINALQFLLIIDSRRMDFGAHEADKSRRFYFPNNSAYILLEVSLPESGTVVLGCVGKGLNYDYEYFAYAGSLNVEEFCLPDGSLVAQPQLVHHLAQYGRRVFRYNSTEFADMIYGRRKPKLAHQQDFCIFRLENAGDASIFQKVLTRTLRLDKLRSSEVKDYLLQIFQRDLPDASLDFKAEWDKAFAGIHADRSQYLAAVRLQDTLRNLEQKQEARLVLRGKLLCWRPWVNAALEQWQQHYETRLQALQHDLNQCKMERGELHEKDMRYAGEQKQYELEKERLLQQNEQWKALRQRFALISSLDLLEERRRDLQEQRDALVVRIGQAQSRTPAAIKREIARIEQELAQLEQELSSQGESLYQHLAALLSAEQLKALTKVLSKPVLTLNRQGFHLDKHALLAALRDASGEALALPGLHLHIQSLPMQHQQRTTAELMEMRGDWQKQRTQLEEQLRTALDLEKVKQQRQDIERDLAQLEQDIREYQRMEVLQQGEAERTARLQALDEALADIKAHLSQSKDRYRALEQRQQSLQQDVLALQQQAQKIEKLRDRRIDHEKPLTWLADLPHHPWLAQPDFALDQLADRLETYHEDCQHLLKLDDQIHRLLEDIHLGGLTKYQFEGDAESEIAKLIDFSNNLQAEAKALEDRSRTAVVNVSAALRELRDGLLAFKRRMNEFNNKISSRQVSDLSVFKIEPEDEAPLVDAINTMIEQSNAINSGESYDLFSQQSILDDEEINRAKTLLIEEGNARHGLRVADLFRLRFWVGKAGRPPESYDDIDSSASNGTVLMIKLITGLAMLHMMQDKRRSMRGVCYLDEALSLDARNQRSLIEAAEDFGFSLIFASPAPLTTARYCVPIHTRNGRNFVSRHNWQIIEPLSET